MVRFVGDESFGSQPQTNDVVAARYPFHLKPKNSQLARCMRMAAGIVHDLNLDDDFLAFQPWEQGVRADDLDKIRTYLAYVYLVST